MALYSKLPVSDARVVQFGETATPSIVATLAANSGEFEMVLAHPMLPMSAERARSRNAQLKEMAKYVGESEGTVLLAGDLNVTMWSPYYREFVEGTGLKNARAGYGLGATFPTALSALGIPIDHILITGPSRVGNFQVHKNVGSDHRPISADVQIVPTSTTGATAM